MDKMHEECGIVGVYGHPDAANLTYLGLYALQHRGQEASGIVTYDGKVFRQKKAQGLVADVFKPKDLTLLKGSMAIGHNRYSTAGDSALDNVQPLMGSSLQGMLAMAHNGNLVNAQVLTRELEASGAVFRSSVDSEVILHLLARSQAKTLKDRIVDSLFRVRGAYSLLFLTEEGLIAVRDPYGVRPLLLGKLGDRAPCPASYIVASESCVFDLIGATLIRDIKPGEVVVINDLGVQSFFPFPKVTSAQCVFEFVYFARPDSTIFSQSVYGIRKRLGQELAKESPVSADIVIAVPDSGVIAALGYSEASMIPFDMGLTRNHYVGRTFIEPKQEIRHFGVKVKLNAVREVLEGKRVVVVDDSIVRGTTSRKIIKMIRAAGAKEVHVRISSPPILSPCFYGIDTPTRSELIASSHTVDEICKHLTADSLQYLSIEGMFRAVYHNDAAKDHHFCRACFTEKYPIALEEKESAQLELFVGD